jgi:hypothetical protein
VAAFFNSKTFGGTTYTLEHLEPFTLVVPDGDKSFRVYVQFGHHCFTEDRENWHSLDRKYEFNGETRSFCTTRFAASKRLPDIIKDLVDKSVYYGKQYNYFVLRNHDLLGNAPPYAVFFDVTKSRDRRKGDAFMRIQSAYQKPNMIDTAAPIAFANLISSIAEGKTALPGRKVVIKRK